MLTPRLKCFREIENGAIRVKLKNRARFLTFFAFSGLLLIRKSRRVDEIGPNLVVQRF